MSQDKTNSSPTATAPPTQRVRPADPKIAPAAPTLRQPSAPPAPPTKKNTDPVD